MRLGRRAAAIVAGAVSLSSVTAGPALSYSPATHSEIGAIAVDRSGLDSILKTQYRTTLGVSSIVNGLSVRELVALGAAREDRPPIRSLNHFHSPLKPWPDAGGILGQSSIYWQQNPEQGLGGTWSWPVARQRLLDFLTLPTPAARAQALADTARALGQAMHMVQDAASPAHTREDPHLLGDGYEARIEELRGSDPDTPLRAKFLGFLDAAAIVPATSIFTATNDSRAPAPVARLIDSDRFAGTPQTYSVGADTGLAEYTNGGYVSDDTIFLGFALPRRENLGPAAADPPDTPGARRYFPMTMPGGDTIKHFVAEGALYERLLFRGQLTGGYMLDERVYDDYAARLIPRAVGYSAGLLDYFFRSNFDFTVAPSGDDPAKRRLTVSIPPQLTAETMDGTFTLYSEDANGLRSAVPGASITTVLSRGASVDTVFTAASGARAYVLAFRGRQGNESGAVTGKVKPTGPLVFAVQAASELTAGETRTITTEVDNASQLVVVERRSKDERHQRAVGSFFSSNGDPGPSLKRVSLEFDPRVVGTPPARLLVDDLDVGLAWNRDDAIVASPSRWEVRIDFPAFYGGSGGLVPNAPRFLTVETTDGIRTRAPLVWWRSVSSLAEVSGLRQSATPCPPELACEEVTTRGTVLHGLVFFGDGDGEGRDTSGAGQRQPLSSPHTSVGFVPVSGVAGFGVGTAQRTGSLECFAACVAAASCATSTVEIFAQAGTAGPVWTKDEFSVSLGTLSGARKDANACARPATPEPAAPNLPELRFRRDYLAADQSRFEEFGVTPPQYEIILR